MYTRMLSGGGSKMASDTLVTTTAQQQEYTIETGISNMKNFIIHGYSMGSYGTGMQHLLRWNWDTNNNNNPQKYYCVFHQGSNGGASYNNFTSTAADRAFVMVSVDAETGIVKIKSPKLQPWCNINFLWVAW